MWRKPFHDSDMQRSGLQLAVACGRVFVLYLAGMWVLWLLAVEVIYQHPTPFYALYLPAFTSFTVPSALLLVGSVVGIVLVVVAGGRPAGQGILYQGVGLALLVLLVSSLLHDIGDGNVGETLGAILSELRWHILAMAVFLVGALLLVWVMRRTDWFRDDIGPREAGLMLCGLVMFVFLFSGAVAMVRGGPDGIKQSYERHGYEYIDDIGKRSSIHDLFRDYNELQPYLSMHAKVHPPGPIVILWLMSYVAGREAMGLSLATMALGALSLIPLYLWVKDLADRRVALTCCILFSLMPSIVLFTATSADIMFLPFVLTTLFLFWRALDRGSIPYALAAGVLYGMLSLISFSLVSLGAFFAIAGLWRFREQRAAVIKTAATMVVGLLALHLAVRWWSGFDVVACFTQSKAQFDTDQMYLDELAPRFPAWSWKLLNPACWFFFAGVPVSLLFVWRLRHREDAQGGLFVVFALTILALDILYLGRGEGERSAMYVLPFVVIPAGFMLDAIGRKAESIGPLLVTVSFLAFQCWFIESIFFTYW